MADLEHQHLEMQIADSARRDPKLNEELQAKLKGISKEDMKSRAFAFNVREPLVDEHGKVTPAGRFVTETIVEPFRRPILTIRNNMVTDTFVGPDSEVWKDRIMGAGDVLNRVIPAVGRVEVANSADFSWLGTGWLIDDDIIVTNRHVAQEFCRRQPQGFSFRRGIGGSPMVPRIDFLEEFERSAVLEYQLTSVLWIAPSDGPDVAFLRVTRRATDAPLTQKITLATNLEGNYFVATIGYPARDDRVPDQDLVKRLFGDVYDKKRLAPGEILSISEDEVEHDCSTLGGNSGSVVVNLATGEAVGLHFAGLYKSANFAVPAPVLASLLKRVKSGELPGVSEIQALPVVVPTAPIGTTPGAPIVLGQPSAVATAGATGGVLTYTYSLQIPIEISVRLGGSGAATAPLAQFGSAGPAAVPAVSTIEAAVLAARQELAGNPDVLEVSEGFRFKRGWITDEPVVVVSVRRKLGFTDLRAAGKSLIPPMVAGYGVDVRTASLSAQLESQGVTALERAGSRTPKPGTYREPPGLGLPRVQERMRAVFHVSPDFGLPTLLSFLGRVEKRLTATMYEWDEGNGISKAIANAMRPAGNAVMMVTQRAGTSKAVEELESKLGNKLAHVYASVGGGGALFPDAYHIKVASRDGEEVWLSSGNWKESNQPALSQSAIDNGNITPFRQFNREWHAVIANRRLAKLFQRYIEFDFSEAQRVAAEEGPVIPELELFVPETAAPIEVEGRGRYFKPLELDREIDIQPLLTPDRDDRRRRVYMKHAIELVKSAQNKLYVQNQSFNLLAENRDEFEAFFTAVSEKQQEGLDVRIIFRDALEFSQSNAESQQKLLERLKRFGIDTEQIKVQRRCHTKGIVVDGQAVLLGSHNLTNSGSLFNRDASLLVRDAEVAEYFEEIFLFDWETLAKQQVEEIVGDVRVARADEATPPGFRRVTLKELMGLD